MQSFDPSKIYGFVFPILIIIGYVFGRYVVLKSLLDKFRACVDSVDNALNDPTISEEDFKKIWDDCYNKFILYLPTPPKKPPVPPQK